MDSERPGLSEPDPNGGPARLGNVTAMLLVGAGKGASPDAGLSTARLLASLFAETLLVGDAAAAAAPGRRLAGAAGAQAPLEAVLAGLEAARAERVLLIDDTFEGGDADLLLALTAWPESEAVVPTEIAGKSAIAATPAVACAIVRRDPARRAARAELAGGGAGAFDWLGRLETTPVPLAELGLAARPTSLGAADPIAIEGR